MSLLYVPVMAAKQGEFTALSKLKVPVANRMMPLFEMPSKKPDTKLFEKSIALTATKAGKVWKHRPAFLDISRWSSNARTEGGAHILEYAFGQFRNNEIVVNPVVGYDRWDDPDYSQALRNIRKMGPITPCIRLDKEAIRDDIFDLPYFTDRMYEIMGELDVGPENCYVLIDMVDVSTTAVPSIISDVEGAIEVLNSMGYKAIIVAGGSMPASVINAVSKTNSEACISRFEMMAWKAIYTASKDRGIIFSDYLIRNTGAAEGVPAIHANGKIRYTIAGQFFMVRGHSKQLDSLTVQHKKLAEKVVASQHYFGAEFSWGDSELLQCSVGMQEIRSAQAMIAVDSNHHISAVIAEVYEHHQTVIAPPFVTPIYTD